VFQSGYRNRFGHPAPDVVARYRDQGVPVVASPACGAWRWSRSEPGVCHRDEVRRYWHHHEAPVPQ
jgi:competence protein ComEC